MIDPKGARPKIHGKSKAYEIIQRDIRLRREFETKVWPALPAGLVQMENPVLEIVSPSSSAENLPTDPV
jgi:hypothetical protein